jgi:hypothetical protein
MLRSFQGGNHHYWPKNADGIQWSLSMVKQGLGEWHNDLFCKACHPIATANYYGNFYNSVHEHTAHRYYQCVDCHKKRIHGYAGGRILNGVWNFTKRAPFDYIKSDCSAECGGYHP